MYTFYTKYFLIERYNGYYEEFTHPFNYKYAPKWFHFTLVLLNIPYMFVYLSTILILGINLMPRIFFDDSTSFLLTISHVPIAMILDSSFLPD